MSNGIWIRCVVNDYYLNIVNCATVRIDKSPRHDDLTEIYFSTGHAHGYVYTKMSPIDLMAWFREKVRPL